jgi:hypothetical protein
MGDISWLWKSWERVGWSQSMKTFTFYFWGVPYCVEILLKHLYSPWIFLFTVFKDIVRERESHRKPEQWTSFLKFLELVSHFQEVSRNFIYNSKKQPHVRKQASFSKIIFSTAKTRFRKFEANIPRKGIDRRSFMCLWAIYLFPWSVC